MRWLLVLLLFGSGQSARAEDIVLRRAEHLPPSAMPGPASRTGSTPKLVLRNGVLHVRGVTPRRPAPAPTSHVRAASTQRRAPVVEGGAKRRVPVVERIATHRAPIVEGVAKRVVAPVRKADVAHQTRPAPATLVLSPATAGTRNTGVESMTAVSLPGALRHAVARSGQVLAQDKSAFATREMAVAAGLLPDPSLVAAIDNRAFDSARADVYLAQSSEERVERRRIVAVIERDTALAWFDLYYAQASAAIIAEQERQARLEFEAASAAYRGGKGTQASLVAAQLELTALDDRSSIAERRVRTARTALVRWIGDAGTLPLAGKPVIDALRFDADLTLRTLESHPQIAVLARKREIAAADVRLARANEQPDWGMPVSSQLELASRQDRRLQALFAREEQARAEKEEALRVLSAEVRALLAEWESGQERLLRFQRELVPLTTRNTAASIAAYRGGKSSLTDVLAARRVEIDMRMQALSLEAELARLWARINFFVPEHDTGWSALASAPA